MVLIVTCCHINANPGRDQETERDPASVLNDQKEISKNQKERFLKKSLKVDRSD